jgi:hypothetical protein
MMLLNVINLDDALRDLHARYQQSSRSMNERERRLWAATEAMKLGRGGITIVSKALRMSRSTIRRGIEDLAAGPADAPAQANGRVRKPGGGRKSK